MATASDFTLTLPALTAGQQGEMTFTRPSGQYSLREVYVTFGGVTEPMAVQVLSQQQTRVVYGFTPPLYWCADLPDAVSGSGRVSAVVAFDSAIDALDDPHVCTLEAAFTLYVPESVRPEATFTVEPVYGNETAQAWGTLLRGISRLRYEVSAQPPTGAALTSCRVRVGSQEAAAMAGELPPFTAAGEFTPTATVHDSRGRSVTVRAEPVTVWDYHRPTLSGISVLRCLADGTVDSGGAYLKVRAVGKCASVGGRNSVSVTVSVRAVGGSWGVPVALDGDGGEKILDADANAVYEARFTATDALGSETAVSSLSGTAAVAFHLRDGGLGAAFGKRAADDGFHCAWDAWFDGALSAASLHLGGKSLLDLTYPVGSVYLSLSDADPATLFGGQWEPIHGRFLLGADSAHAANSVGGSESHTLTAAQMPAHSHRVRGDTDATNVGHDHSIPNIRTGQSGEYGAYAETWGYGTGSRNLYTDHTDITHIHRVDITSQTAGSGQAFSLLPPYLAVYMWRRTA